MSHLTCSLLTQYLDDHGEVMEMVPEVMISGLLVPGRRSTICSMSLRVLRDNHEYMGRIKLNYGKNLHSIIELTLSNNTGWATKKVARVHSIA